MSRERNLKLEKYGISDARYKELLWLARQYDELKRKERAYRRGEVDRVGGGNGAWKGVSDPTAAGGMRLASSPYAWKIAAIEQAAAAADAGLCRHILDNVARGRTFEDMGPPCARNTFFAARARFFAELDRRYP